MERLILQKRLRTYVNTGAAGFLIIFIALCILRESSVLLAPLLFNITLLFMVCKGKPRGRNIITAAISALLATILVGLQYQYRHYIDHGCLQMISDESANTAYASVIVVSSIILFEASALWREKYS